jgi:pimeloyl-ACP methyl ester carboxylesterase
MVRAGGFDTRYRTWGTHGSPVVLVPGAFETADTFAALGAALGTDHRVFAFDLTGTGYSAPSPPFDAGHLAAKLVAFLAAKGLTGPDAPVLVGALQRRGRRGDGGAARPCPPRAPRGIGGRVPGRGRDPLAMPPVVGWLLINPYRTTILRLALSLDWLIRKIYDSQAARAARGSAPPGSRPGAVRYSSPVRLRHRPHSCSCYGDLDRESPGRDVSRQEDPLNGPRIFG